MQAVVKLFVINMLVMVVGMTHAWAEQLTFEIRGVVDQSAVEGVSAGDAASVIFSYESDALLWWEQIQTDGESVHLFDDDSPMSEILVSFDSAQTQFHFNTAQYPMGFSVLNYLNNLKTPSCLLIHLTLNTRK